MRAKNFGVIGLGATGTAVAGRFLEHGCAVTVYDRDPWKVAAVVGAGAEPARIPADAAESADLVVVDVLEETELEEVLFDCGGVGETLRENGTVVVASPPTSASASSIAGRLGALGLSTVEAGFTHGVCGSSATVLVGCAPDALGTVAATFGAMGLKVLHSGPVGTVAALSRIVAALAAIPAATAAGGTQAAPVVDPRAVLGVLAGGMPGDAAQGAGSRCPSAGAAALADAVARVWLAARDAARDGVELVSVESTVTALFPERPDGDAHSCEHRALPEQRRRSAGDPGSRALEQSDLESVIVDLERRFGLPLLLEALQCRTPSDLAALVRTQLTSGA